MAELACVRRGLASCCVSGNYNAESSEFQCSTLVVVALCELLFTALMCRVCMQGGSVVLVQSAIIQQDQERLRSIEDDLMGMDGNQAILQAKKAQALEQQIHNLEFQTTLRPKAPARVQALTTTVFPVRKPRNAMIAHGRMNSWMPTQVARQQARQAEERGSFSLKPFGYGLATAKPLDTSTNGMASAQEQAAILARNLAKFNHATGKRSSKFHPTMSLNFVAPHATYQRSQASMGTAEADALHQALDAPPGYVSVEAIEPGQPLPPGAVVFKQSQLDKIRGVKKRPVEFMSVPRFGRQSHLLEEVNATATEETVEEEAAASNETVAEVEAEEVEADAGNSTNATNATNGTEAEEREPTVGNTNMTESELTVYAGACPVCVCVYVCVCTCVFCHVCLSCVSVCTCACVQ
jgi:hypothetical protein